MPKLTGSLHEDLRRSCAATAAVAGLISSALTAHIIHVSSCWLSTRLSARTAIAFQQAQADSARDALSYYCVNQLKMSPPFGSQEG